MTAMNLDPTFLAKLRSPGGLKPLRIARADELEALAEAFRQGRLVLRSGKPVESAPVAGLVCEAEGVLFRVDDDIPVLLAEEAIVLPVRTSGTGSSGGN